MNKIKIISLIVIAFTMTSCGGRQSNRQAGQDVAEAVAPFVQVVPDGWEAMIDGNSLEGWEVVRAGGEGEPTVKDGILTLPMAPFGNSTGLRLEDEDAFPAINYAIYYEARRIEGNDIFGGVSFPYGDTYASLIVGGWGGATCGLSSIDGKDASSNETTTYINFEDNVWYPVYLRVTTDSIIAVINDVTVANIATDGKRIHLRSGTFVPSLTFSTFRTGGQIRNLRMKRIE